MRKKLFIGVTVLTIFLTAGSIYSIRSIEKTATKLHNIIRLHQVEILREQLLMQLMQVQFELYLDPSFNRSTGPSTMLRLDQLEVSAGSCFSCHHPKNIVVRLNDVKSQIGEYKVSVDKILTLRAKRGIAGQLENTTYKMGQALISNVDSIIKETSSILKERTEAALADISRTKKIFYIRLVVYSVLFIGLALMLIINITKQLNIILNSINRLKNGDFSYRIPPGLKDEFKKLATAFNDMAANLSNHIKQMQRTEQLAVSGQMAAGLAHEIKNPLAGIKVAVEVLIDELELSTEDRNALVGVLMQVKRLESLVKEMLDFARPLKPQFQLVSINDIVDKTVNFILKQPSLALDESNSIKVIKDFDNNLPMTMADPMQLQQVIVNLMLNSVEAMPVGGILTAKTFYDPADDLIKIDVSDTGLGMHEKLKDKIFQPFFTTKPKGTGLGLPISKQIIENHEGNISVRNNEDRGVTFRIILPVIQSEENS